MQMMHMYNTTCILRTVCTGVLIQRIVFDISLVRSAGYVLVRMQFYYKLL